MALGDLLLFPGAAGVQFFQHEIDTVLPPENFVADDKGWYSDHADLGSFGRMLMQA